MDIEINEGFQRAEMALERGENIFLTGKAGTGKSTFLRHFLKTTKKNVVVLAPTGVAALHVEGQTIHSFYGIFPQHNKTNVPEIVKRKGTILYDILSCTDVLIIDEISMVRADLLDMIDEITREVFARQKSKESMERATKPFAGIQLLFIGDLYQLPPVLKSEEKDLFYETYESPYFFSSLCYPSLHMVMYEFEKVYRQSDTVFVEVLNRIRTGTLRDEDIAFLNRRYNPDFFPGDQAYIYLTTHNKIVDEINERELSQLPSRAHVYKGHSEGEFPEKDMPVEKDLTLKRGAQVMFLMNDPLGRWVNGSLGKVVACHKETVVVELENGEEETVGSFTWVSYRYEASGTKDIKKTPIGSYTQLPLRLAWGLTVHKSQGKTFSHVMLDMRHGTFSPGQMYVALSRVKNLDGLVLVHPLHQKHVKIDKHVATFMTHMRSQQAEKGFSIEERKRIP